MWSGLWQWNTQLPGLSASKARVVLLARWHLERVAQGAGKTLAIQRHHLEAVAVQVHGLGHRGAVDQLDLDPLARRDTQRLVAAVNVAVEAPAIVRAATGQGHFIAPIGRLGGQRRGRP